MFDRAPTLADMSDETVHDSPTGWVADHIDEYVSSGGESGHEWRGTQTLLLTTRGRKSGKLRRSALIYGEDGDRYVLVASKGGAPNHPSWYFNLTANPEVRIQVGAEEMAGKALTATGDERARLWAMMLGRWPDYAEYQKKTDREIPVVVIEPD
jgi:deazaflavin-dependent oxidoreductase (nitroreductase family)